MVSDVTWAAGTSSAGFEQASKRNTGSEAENRRRIEPGVKRRSESVFNIRLLCNSPCGHEQVSFVSFVPFLDPFREAMYHQEEENT